MATLKFLDRCQFLTVTTGTTDWAVGAAVTGYQTPALAGAANGDTFHYFAQSGDLTQWEVGLGTYSTSGPTLARTTVLFSSNSGSKVSFTAGPQIAATLVGEVIGLPISFTPTIKLGGAAVGVTYTVQEGWYTKIGRRIFIDAIIALSSKGSSTGTLTIEGFPFAVSAVGSSVRYNSVVACQNMNAAWAPIQVFTAPAPGATNTAIFYTIAAGATLSNLTDTDITNTSVFRLAINFPTDT